MISCFRCQVKVFVHPLHEGSGCILQNLAFHLRIERINVLLQIHRAGDGGGNVDVVNRVIHAAVFAIFQVFLQHLIAADLIFPHLGRDALEVFVGVDADAPLGRVVAHSFAVARTSRRGPVSPPAFSPRCSR